MCVHMKADRNTDTDPAGPSADPIGPDAWQGSHWSITFQVTGMTRSAKKPHGEYRLFGPVVKASAAVSIAEDSGFESRLRRDFFRGRVIPVT